MVKQVFTLYIYKIIRLDSEVPLYPTLPVLTIFKIHPWANLSLYIAITSEPNARLKKIKWDSESTRGGLNVQSLNLLFLGLSVGEFQIFGLNNRM